MIEIKYKIKELNTKNLGSFNDYVVSVVFEVVGTLNGDYKSFTQTTEFKINENTAGFISYGELTEEIVIGWVKNNIGRRADALESIIKKYFDIRENPPQMPISKPLPF